MNRTLLKGSLLALLILALGALPVVAQSPEGDRSFNRSGIVEGERTLRPAGAGVEYPEAKKVGVESDLAVANVNMIDGYDVVQEEEINNTPVNTCNPGKQTAQNETVIAVNPSDPNNLVGGANDYRLYEASENRYDGSGGFYRSIDGGANWTAGFLPGLVRGNSTDPGPYESAGDPAIAAGPENVFWYANIAFNRGDDANGIGVSRSTDGGANWSTHFVIQTSAAQGANLFNDKEWIAADPDDPNTAIVTWTQFQGITSFIVYSKTTDGGVHWSKAKKVSNLAINQGSVVWIDKPGNVYVVWITSSGGSKVAFAKMASGNTTFGATQLIASVNEIPDPLNWAQFRTNSFPAFALDGKKLHVVWANWTGSHADIVYIRSKNRGNSWSSPKTIGGGASDQFYPWVAAKGGKVAAMYLDHKALGGQKYNVKVVTSTDNGTTWTNPLKINKKVSDVAQGNEFSYPDCAPNFIGDYSGIAVGTDGLAHPMWTDIREGNSPGDPESTYDQDPYTARVTP